MDVSMQNEVKRIVFTKALYSVSLCVFCLVFFLLSLIKLRSPSRHSFFISFPVCSTVTVLVLTHHPEDTSEHNDKMSFKSCFPVHTGVHRGRYFLLSGQRQGERGSAEWNLHWFGG